MLGRNKRPINYCDDVSNSSDGSLSPTDAKTDARKARRIRNRMSAQKSRDKVEGLIEQIAFATDYENSYNRIDVLQHAAPACEGYKKEIERLTALLRERPSTEAPPKIVSPVGLYSEALKISGSVAPRLDSFFPAAVAAKPALSVVTNTVSLEPLLAIDDDLSDSQLFVDGDDFVFFPAAVAAKPAFPVVTNTVSLEPLPAIDDLFDSQLFANGDDSVLSCGPL